MEIELTEEMDWTATVERLVKLGLMPVNQLPYLKRAIQHMKKDMFLPVRERQVFYDFVQKVMDVALGNPGILRLVMNKTGALRREEVELPEAKVLKKDNKNPKQKIVVKGARDPMSDANIDGNMREEVTEETIPVMSDRDKVLVRLSKQTISESKECGVCGGPNVVLGKLGNLVHSRCSNCGMISSSTRRTRKLKETSSRDILDRPKDALRKEEIEPTVIENITLAGKLKYIKARKEPTPRIHKDDLHTDRKNEHPTEKANRRIQKVADEEVQHEAPIVAELSDSKLRSYKFAAGVDQRVATKKMVNPHASVRAVAVSRFVKREKGRRVADTRLRKEEVEMTESYQERFALALERFGVKDFAALATEDTKAFLAYVETLDESIVTANTKRTAPLSDEEKAQVDKDVAKHKEKIARLVQSAKKEFDSIPKPPISKARQKFLDDRKKKEK